MLSVKAIFGYLAFALLAAVLFLYLLFPEAAVKSYLEARLAAIDPRLGMDVENIRPVLPPGLKMTAVEIKQDGVRLAHLDSVRVRPELMTLLESEKHARFEGALGDGTISGRITAAGNNPTAVSRMTADLTGIRIEDIDAVKRLERFTLTGLVNGHMTRGDARDPAGPISGMLTTSGLRIGLAEPFLGIADIAVTKCDTEFSIAGQTLRIKSMTFDGPMVEGRIGGTVDIRYPIAQSRLNLTGNAKPKPDLFARLQETVPQEMLNPRTVGTRGITFRIRGTVDSPELSMR